MASILQDQPDAATRVITINRPQKLNACDGEAWAALGQRFRALAADRSVRLVILTGAGGHFSSGDDIKAYAAIRPDAAGAAAYRAQIQEAHDAIERAPFPVIAAIQGVCVGGGCSIALCCDFRVGRTGARIGIPAAKLGLVYSLDHCVRLANAVGLANAKRMLYGGELLDADAAQAIGFLDRHADLDPVTQAIAFGRSMAANAPLSIAAAKRTLTAIAHGRADAERASLAEAFLKVDGSQDAVEGARAFAEKRPPNFRGE